MANKNLENIKAITFDVQGTCVDFVQPLVQVGEKLNQQKGLTINWDGLVMEWRLLYRAVLDEVIAGKRPWVVVEHIYRETLNTLLDNNGLSSQFSALERELLNSSWFHLQPWPDSREGLQRLRQKFVTATLSNTAMSTMVSIVKYAGLPFDAILTAELAHDYKPSRKVYQLAVDYLGFPPDAILMVACHKYDLNAARLFGMRTAFVARPLEFGKNGKPDIAPEPWFDLYAADFMQLAEALGA